MIKRVLYLDDEPFTTGSTVYLDNLAGLSSSQSSIHVPIAVGDKTRISTTARLDPATPWVVLNRELNKQLGFVAVNPDKVLRTLAGEVKGSLERCSILLEAEYGKSLEIEATLFVCNEWTRENFLRYSGILERIRFAVDPSTQRFHFGPY